MYSYLPITLTAGLRVKVDSSYLASWRDTTANNKPIDTSGIFDMIVAYNSNFNGHDQQVRERPHTQLLLLLCLVCAQYIL